MDNTVRDRTEEHRDRDDLGQEIIPPPQAPAADHTPHIPGSATELAELRRAMQPPTVGQASPAP